MIYNETEYKIATRMKQQKMNVALNKTGQNLEIYGNWLVYKDKEGVLIVRVIPASLQARFKSKTEYTTLVKIQNKSVS